MAAVAAGLSMLAAPEAHANPAQDCLAGRTPEARIKACTEVIEGAAFSAGQKAVAFRNRGRSRVEAGVLDKAMDDLNEAARLNPGDAHVFTYRAQLHVARNDLDAAIRDYGEVIRLRPKSAVGLTGRGHAFLVKGDARRAVEDFSQALALAPGNAVAHNNRGLARKAAGDLPGAIQDFTAAIAINPVYALAYNNRGYAHEAAGSREAAIADFKSALRLDPALTGARDGLQRLGVSGTLAAESSLLVTQGQKLVEQHCAWCHAVARKGTSPNPNAPPFVTLHERHPMLALREPLTRGIAAPHDQMPDFDLPDADIDKIVAYINSLGGPQ
jgi:tetratricopeptide (TPR) repeat protein